ncbi:MAG: hypothetical protein M1832_002686 [Thelocarpon impressellum]|nr:MAG: hypothetical protein M1832_002686 [Thelocarpon impressellum]
MWRDRTNLYISYRQSYSHHPSKKPRFAGPSSSGDAFSSSAPLAEERRGLMSAGAFEDDGDAVIEMDLLPPRWVDVGDEVTELLADIAKKSAKLDRLHSKHVLPGFDDERVRREEEGEIERLTQDITRGFHACQRAIQRVDQMVRDSQAQGAPVSKGDEAMARNIQISLAGRVQEASAGFRKKQSAYLKKLRGFGGMASPLDRSSSPQIAQNPYSDPSLQESDADKSYSQSTLQQTSQSQRLLTSNDAAIAHREREIAEIATGIIELSDIFRELQGMVIDQGTMLDRIDYNVERMAVDVKAADKELKVASGYQRRSTKRKVLLLLAVLVLAMLVLLLVKPRRRASPPSPSPPDPAPPDPAPPVAAADVPDPPPKAAAFLARPRRSVPSSAADVLAPGEWKRRRRRGRRRERHPDRL